MSGFEIAPKVTHFWESIDEMPMSTQQISKISIQNEAFLLQQSVIETNINQNCMIKGNWISCEQNWFPQFREFGQMVSHQGSIYLSGGFGNSVNNDFCQFDLTSNKWSSLQNVIPRYGHTMTSILSELYVIGGEQINNYGPLRSKCFVNEIQKFDGEKWHTIRYAGIFQMRKYHAATSYKDSIFIVGGEGFKNKVLSDIVFFQEKIIFSNQNFSSQILRFSN